MLNSFFYIELICCLMMTGLIWTIQLVHYPSFMYIEKTQFKSFAYFHQARITYIVAPLMLFEMLASITQVIFNFNTINTLLSFFLVIIWLVTFLWSIPCHQKLSEGHDKESITKLVKTNWPRTLLWTLRSIILIKLLFAA